MNPKDFKKFEVTNTIPTPYLREVKKNKDYYIYKLKSDQPIPVIFTELDFKNLRKALNFVIFVDYPKLTALAE